MSECSCHTSPPCNYCIEGVESEERCPKCDVELRENDIVRWCTKCQEVWDK